jgi:hypothetical protein
MIETGLWPDFMAGKNIKVRAMTKILSNDEFGYEMSMIGDDGKEFKSLENRSVRKKIKRMGAVLIENHPRRHKNVNKRRKK